jgi:DNA repair exonuclease SbcCD ATPase subunit
MKISALRLFNVKRFAGRGKAIEGIGDGVNVLCAANEFGKSTSFEALHALFFQRHSGTPDPVRRLRPYKGGNPLVEADIVTAEGRFRVAKQFYGGGWARITDLDSGRLLFQADEAENFIAGLIRGGPAGPAGLLWVRQGVTGIERRSDAEEKGERQVRQNLLESVQGEVEAVTGGRRMAEIMAAVEGALADLVTATGKAKAGGRYYAATEERDRLAAEERKLAGEVESLREALEKRADAARRVAELDNAEDRRERRTAVETAEAAFGAAKVQGEALNTAEAELKLVRERRDTADGALKAFRSALERAESLSESLRDAARRRTEAADKRRRADEAVEKARRNAETAEAREQDTRALLDRLNAALKARDASERLAELQERLRQAEAARRAVEASQAELALAKLPPNAVDELHDAEVEIARLRAAEEAARPSVAVSYENGEAGRVAMDGAPLKDGEERSYDGQARLSVPGVGTITLRSNRPARTDDELGVAEARRRTLLASMGVGDLAAARNRQAQAQQIEAALREQKGRLALLAPDGLEKLREEVAGRAALGAEVLELKGDPAEAKAALAVAEEQRKQAKQELREVEHLPGSAVDAIVEAETQLASLNADRLQLEAVLGPADERGRRRETLSGALAGSEQALAAADAHAQTLRTATADLESAEARLKRARSAEDAVEKQVNNLRETIAGLDGHIRRDADDAVEEKWRETTEALAAAEARVAAFEKEVAVLQRLSSALATARSQARELYLRPVMGELKPLLGLLFDDVSISFDEKTLLPQTILRDGQEEEVDRLSGGMREQLSVLTRLAFARLLARDGRPAPVILDDALVYSDDDRIEKMFDALHRQSKDLQIIVFSCRQRAFQKLGGNPLQMTDWHP